MAAYVSLTERQSKIYASPLTYICYHLGDQLGQIKNVYIINLAEAKRVSLEKYALIQIIFA